MKGLTGNDMITCRQLFSEQISYFPQYTLFMSCNDVPVPTSFDEGTWRRLRVILFERKFVPKATKESEADIDFTLDERIKTMGPAFIWILVDLIRQYPSHEIEECSNVVEYTDALRKEVDVFGQFSDECLRERTVEEDAENITTMFDTICELMHAFCDLHKLRQTKRHALERYIKDKYTGSILNG